VSSWVTPCVVSPHTTRCCVHGCRSAQRAAVMAQRVAAIEERERQRRYRQASLGQAATPGAAGDMGRLMAQIQSGEAADASQQTQQRQQQQQQQPPPKG
jgi:hypothetical protein